MARLFGTAMLLGLSPEGAQSLSDEPVFQTKTTTSTPIPGVCLPPMLGESMDVSACYDIFPPGVCEVTCAEGYSGRPSTYYCYSSEAGFVGREPQCTTTTEAPTTTPEASTCHAHSDCGEDEVCIDGETHTSNCMVGCYCASQPCDLYQYWVLEGCVKYEDQDVEWMGRTLPSVVEQCHDSQDSVMVAVKKGAIAAYGGSCYSYCAHQGLACRTAVNTTADYCWDRSDMHQEVDCMADVGMDRDGSIFCECQDVGKPWRRSIEEADTDVAQVCKHFLTIYSQCVEWEMEHGMAEEYGLSQPPSSMWSRLNREARGNSKCATVDADKYWRLGVLGCANSGPL